MTDRDLIYDAMINPSCGQVAKLFKSYYPKLFVCVKNQWYMAPSRNSFTKEWKHLKGDYELIVFIDMYFIPLFEQMQKNYCDSINESTNLNYKEEILGVMLCLSQLIDNLNSKVYKEFLCKELKFYYSSE